MNIILYNDPVIKNLSENMNKNTPLLGDTNTANEYAEKSVKDGSLKKKYIFGFSGIDTSVLQIFNNYDMLWYMLIYKYMMLMYIMEICNLKVKLKSVIIRPRYRILYFYN